jgi:hypothetical protein
MLKGKGPILQRDLEQLATFQRAFRDILNYLYAQLRDGREIEPGKRTVNIPALMFQFPQIIITTEFEVPCSSKLPEIPSDGFASMQKLLSDREAAGLRQGGFREAAKAQRVASRMTYRILLPLYVRHSKEVFRRRLFAYLESGQKKGCIEIFVEILKMRFNVIKLVLAPLVHLLRLPLVDPCKLVKSGMRGIAFVLNQLAPLPPGWK